MHQPEKTTLEAYLASKKRSHRRIVAVNVIAGLIGIAIFTVAAIMSWQLQKEIEQKREILKELHKILAKNRMQRLENKKLVVGRKNFLEQDILCEIMARVIETENPELEVVRGVRRETRNNYNQLRLGEIDLYVEYTGTAIVELLNLPVHKAANATLTTLNSLFLDRNLKWLQPLGFNNTYVIVMLKQTADSLGIEAISDLSEFAHELTFAFDDEFYLREADGYEAFKRQYDLEINDERLRLVRKDFKLVPLIKKEAEVATAYATDPELMLQGDKFVILEDDKDFFPPYHAAPLVHQEVLELFPNIEKSLNSLSGQISELEMATLIEQAQNSGFHPTRNPEVLTDIVDNFLHQKWPRRFSGI